MPTLDKPTLAGDPKLAEAPKSEEVNFLVSRRFPGNWPAGTPRPKTLHDGSPEALAFEAELRRKSPDEIRDLVREEEWKIYEEQEARRSSDDDRRFFSRVTAEAQISHWAKLAYWTLDEAVALSFGKEPEVVYWESIKSMVMTSPFVQEYQRRSDIAERAEKSGQLSFTSTPADFLDWADRFEIPFPTELRRAVDVFAPAREPWKERYAAEVTAHQDTKRRLESLNSEATLSSANLTPKDEPSPMTREKESLLKLVLGMAIRGYGYQPRSLKNLAVKEIADDLRLLGLGLDEDTVRKYLQRAKAEFPDLKTEDDSS